MENIRNFSIIAHIDHGKSTLADRFIQLCGMVTDRQFHDQLLDSMDIERERGITIKSQAICLPYRAKNGKDYTLNLVDTPGHVDFSYEVSRALASCEGALLLVDAAQGIEAQTLANLYLAMEHNLEIIPVINKIDLPSADPEGVALQIEEDLGLDADHIQLCSAKTGQGVDAVLEAVVNLLPPPKGDPEKPLEALIFDAFYDPFRGTIISCRLFEGRIKAGDTMLFMANNAAYRVEEVGVFRLTREPQKELSAGQVGYIIAGIKNITDTRPGDTITLKDRPCAKPLPGFQEIKQVVFSSIYPVSTDDYETLSTALEKLTLNDASLSFQKDASTALGFGFRCGFLGLLHMDIVQERLEREYDMDLITTAPSVVYQVRLRDGSTLTVDNPSRMPDVGRIESILEPIVAVRLFMPQQYVGTVMTLCNAKRGVQTNMAYMGRQVQLSYEMPLAEIVLDFFDKLKSVSRGYASMDYSFLEYRAADVVKVDILINGERVDALSLIVHRSQSQYRGREVTAKMRELIPRQMFDVAIQAAIGANIIARETIKAMRKNVLAKCYGGDITRKRKLLEKQKAGKKRMKQIGTVEVPQEAFLAILKVDD